MGDLIKNVLRTLKDFIGFCSEDVRKPSEQCNKVLYNAENNCKHILTKWFDYLCFPVPLVRKAACGSAKLFDLLCILPSFIKENLCVPIKKAITKLYRDAKDKFTLKVVIKEKLVHKITPSKSLKEVSKDINKEMQKMLSFKLPDLLRHSLI